MDVNERVKEIKEREGLVTNQDVLVFLIKYYDLENPKMMQVLIKRIYARWARGINREMMGQMRVLRASVSGLVKRVDH